MPASAIPGLTRHYVTLGERQLHYRRMGSGPALVMLHRAPRSTADLVPFIQEAAQHFTVIAIDLAGYGNSWQLFLPSEGSGHRMPTVTDYVNDIDAALKELGIQRALVYGEHFGALVALQLAVRDPKRIAAAVLNGLAVTMTEADKAEARNSYPAFEPKWDGSHLAWLWAHLREENVFYPSWRKTLANRLEEDMPAPEKLHARVLQFLADGRNPFDNTRHMTQGRQRTFTTGRLGRGYHLAYLAALEFNPLPQLAHVTQPVLITGSRLFQKDLERARVTQRAVPCEVKQADDLAGARAAAVDFLGRHAAKVPPPPEAPPPKPIPGALWGSFISVPGGQVHAYMNDDVSTLPIVLQHDAISSVAAVESIGRGLVGRRTILAFDLPGLGDSDNTVNVDAPDVGYFADALRAVLDVFDLAQVDYYGMRGGGIIGLEMALRKPAGIRRLIMSSAYEARGHQERFSEAMKEIAPQWYGGHLLECWHHMRDEALYSPWFNKTRGAVIKREPMLDPNLIHMRVCSLLKAGNNYQGAYRACVAYPTHEKLAQCQVPIVLGTTKWDPNNASTTAAAKAAPKSKLQLFDDDISRWGESFIGILEDADRAG